VLKFHELIFFLVIRLKGLYIKPIARLNLTIQLPPTKQPGQTVSNNEILEKVKKQSLPDEFIYLRVIKSSLEFIRCEGEIENKSSFKTLLAKLDNSTIRMNAYADVLKIRAAESKLPYPTRHDWDSFFKDSQNPNAELKHGERPDTVYIADLPCKWFTANTTSDMPCEQSLKEVFSIFGDIRLIDIPLVHGLASKKTSIPIYSDHNVAIDANQMEPFAIFDAYIQFKDYISFVKAMDTFRGMKLLHIDDNKNCAFTANIRVSCVFI
jgi:splicing factor, arginine/serine-rich 17